MVSMFFLSIETACGPSIDFHGLPIIDNSFTQSAPVPLIYRLPIDYLKTAFVLYLLLILTETLYENKTSRSWKKTLTVVILLSVVFALLWGFNRVITCLY